MGFTHYWKQKRDHTTMQWADIAVDIGAILDHVSTKHGIKLVKEYDEPKSPPFLGPNHIQFNGAGEQGHETFWLNRGIPPLDEWQEPSERGGAFCKTERKPYDLAVVAVLCYLGTVSKTYAVTSDGYAKDWVAGLEAAREALPRYANILDIPIEILQDERWCPPWVDNKANGYEVRFCKDGHGYVMKGAESYRFPTHLDLAKWLDANKEAKFRKGGKVRFSATYSSGYGPHEQNIWRAMGAFDKARNDRLAAAQRVKLAKLFPAPPENAHQPPAIARPGEFADPPFFYSYGDLLKAA